MDPGNDSLAGIGIPSAQEHKEYVGLLQDFGANIRDRLTNSIFAHHQGQRPAGPWSARVGIPFSPGPYSFSLMRAVQPRQYLVQVR